MELAPPSPEAPAAAAAKTRRLSEEPSTGRRRRVNDAKGLRARQRGHQKAQHEVATDRRVDAARGAGRHNNAQGHRAGR